MRNLETVSYVTANYPHLQGLRILPLAAPFLTAAAWQVGWLPWPATVAARPGRWFLVALVVALCGSAAVGRYYRSHYGVVQPHLLDGASRVMLVDLAVFGALIGLQLVEQWPASLPMLFLGVVFIGLGMAHGGLRKHYAIIGAGCLLFSTFRPLGMSGDTRRALLDVLIGGGVVVAGVGDHRVLQRMLRSPDGEATEATEVTEVYDRAV